MRTVAFLNKKGGVGKTSACHHLSGALARKGLRVLLVDADPQASLSQGLLGPEVARAMAPTGTIAAIFDEAGGPPIGDLIRPTADRGRVAPGRLGGDGRPERDAAVGNRAAPVRPAGRPGRGGGRVRPDPDRLPAQRPARLLERPGGGRRGRRPAPGRRLRCPGTGRHPPVDRPGPGPRRTPG